MHCLRDVLLSISDRMTRERETVDRMIGLYCRKRHHSVNNTLCDSCLELRKYAMKRLGRCPFQEGKTSCGNCPVHCYTGEMKEKIKDVMRVAGPMMPWRHPCLAFMHFIDGFRKKPRRNRRCGRTS